MDRQPDQDAQSQGRRSRNVVLLLACAVALGRGGVTHGAPFASSAAPGAIAGRVLSGGAPVPDANIAVIGARAGAIADENGRFRVDRLPPGSQTVVVRSIGCRAETVTVIVRANAVDSMEVRIHCLVRRVNPDEVMPNAKEMARVGQPCPVHPDVRLARDVVPVIQFDAMIRQEDHFTRLERDSFPNARLTYAVSSAVYYLIGDTLVTSGKTEVAYCWKCREARLRHHPPGGWR